MELVQETLYFIQTLHRRNTAEREVSPHIYRKQKHTTAIQKRQKHQGRIQQTANKRDFNYSSRPEVLHC